jgi:DNA modification methylase
MKLFLKTKLATLWQGDSLDVLRRLPSQSVHCAVTSPPYWKISETTGRERGKAAIRAVTIVTASAVSPRLKKGR